MSIKKISMALVSINVLQFIIGSVIWIVIGRTVMNEVNIYIYVSLGVLLFGNLVTIFGLYFASRYKNADMMESIQNLEELNTKLRSERHDYLNHFQVIYGLLELEEYEEIKNYINPVYKDILKVSKALKTAQPAVNALLQAKMEVAEKKGIDLFLEIRSDLRNLPIEPWNLCKVLANVIDNGITAVSAQEKEKSIWIEISEDLDHYTFLISNNGPEIDKNLINDIFKQGVTTKQEPNHGMGLAIALRIVQEAEGFIQVSSKPDKTIFTIELPKQSGMSNH
ncbi:MAG: Spo0B domain-containing protein [Mobilitalea sp.]